MLPHPILALESDADFTTRAVTELPRLYDEYFACLEAIYIDGKGGDYRTRLGIAHSNIERRMLFFKRVPTYAFCRRNGKTGKLEPDGKLPMLLHRLIQLSRQDVIGVGPQALSWKKSCQRVARECAERMREVKVCFGPTRRWQRRIVEYGSRSFFVGLIAYIVVALFAAAVLVVFPIVRPERAVGASVGCVAAALLLLLSYFLLAHFVLVVRALDMLYGDFEHVYTCYGGNLGEWIASVRRDKALFLGLTPGQSSTVSDMHTLSAGSPMLPTPNAGGANNNNMNNNNNANNNNTTTITHSLMNGAGAVAGSGAEHMRQNSLLRARDTRRGCYSFPYEQDVGCIDGKDLDAQVVMVAYDKAFRITRWNNAAEVMTGFLEKGCLGKPLSELVTPAGGGDICDELRNARRGAPMRIKLRSLVGAPIAVFTIVAPIIGPEQEEPVGSILICANARDNVREYRAYVHNYEIYEVAESLAHILKHFRLPPQESSLLNAVRSFAANGTSNRVEEVAREMLTGWEWTNVEQVIAQALGGNAGRHEVNVDPLFPPTLCISPLVCRAISTIVSLAAGRCSISLLMVNRANNIFALAVEVRSAEKADTAHTWDAEKLGRSMRTLLVSTAGAMYCVQQRVILHFPCQVAAILDETGESDSSLTDNMLLLTQARAIVNCKVNVITAVTNMVDQHNLSLLLLRTMFVSLTSVQDRDDLQKQLAARPCEVDVVICDSQWLSAARDVLLTGDHGAIVIPLVDANTPLSQDFTYVIHMPIVGRDVQQMIIEVGKTVSMKKNAAAALKEREDILTLRQDSPWTKGRLLGRGAYGAVYEATSDLTGGKMAVKMFYFADDREASINQLLNEIKIMCSLNHPNVVHYFHCERKDNSVNLFMELCECSLTDLILGVRPKPAHLTVVQIIRQVVTAVAYLHSRGIAHRDIKPQNILLKGDMVKLTDFGTARKGNVIKEVQGTFRYMAPEVYKGEPQSLSCDIWSIGCLVCELFACPPQFMEHSTLLGTMTSVTSYLEDIPDNVLLRDVLYKCFRLDPEQRPTSRELLTHALLASDAIFTDVDKLTTVFDAAQQAKLQARNYSAFSISSV